MVGNTIYNYIRRAPKKYKVENLCIRIKTAILAVLLFLFKTNFSYQILILRIQSATSFAYHSTLLEY